MQPAPSPLLVFADDWGRHPSSCQHLIRRLREHHSVLWVNTIGTRQVRADRFTLQRGFEKIRNWMKGLQQVGSQMWVVDLPMLPALGGQLGRGMNRMVASVYLRQTLARLGMNRPVVLTTLPYIHWLIRDLPRRSLVYYCTDDYAHWPDADRDTLIRADREITARADLVLAASVSLTQSHFQARRCEYFPHGVDFAHFASAQQLLPAEELSAVPGPRIGFFGLIYEKIDFGLLTALARRFPEASLVMIGPVVCCPPEFKALPNVRFLGQKPYPELPRYLAGLDVLLMPYLLDEMIRQSGPLKLRECLASGKPTVSVDVADVRPLCPHVRIGVDESSFLEEVRRALAEPGDAAVVAARQAAVANEGWDQRAQTLRGCLEDLSYRGSGLHSPRRVLHLRTVSGKGGGPEKTLLNSPRFLRGRYDLRLAYIRPENDPDYDMPARAARAGVDLVDVPERGAADPRTVWRLAREVARYQPHILHAHDYKTNALAVVLGAWFNVPALTTLHGYVTRTPRLELYYAVDRWALRRMRHVIAVSEDLIAELDRIGIRPPRRSLIENAIDTEDSRRRRDVEVAKGALGIPPRRLLIGAVGRLSAEKGFDVLIEAVARLARAGLDVELRIAGEGEERPRLESLLTSSGLGEHGRLVGYLADPRLFYEALDVYALSSHREGLPNVLLEAMALSVPVVATRVAGIPRLVQEGVNGLLVPPGDAPALTAALDRLLRDAARRAELGRAGRETIEKRYSFAARMEKIQAVYDRLVAR